ncbi:MAG: hypothetical protein ACYSRR_03890 [Planctomycetota bacterium]|jgi:hypothetical protein
MKRVLAICFCVCLTSGVVSADIVYIDDGGNHTIDDLTYQNDDVWLDSVISNNPGTHVDLKDGGVVGDHLGAFNNSTITMTGGTAETLFAKDNSSITMTGGSTYNDFKVLDNAEGIMTDGSVGRYLWASGNAIIHMTGGSIGQLLYASESGKIIMTGGEVVGLGDIVTRDNSIIIMSGGSADRDLRAENNSTIYLDGTGFEIGGQALSYGDKLSDFGTLFDEGGENEYYGGIVTGTLADGTFLNNNFIIRNTGDYAGTADIIIAPEPCSLVLLALGGLLLHRRKHA